MNTRCKFFFGMKYTLVSIVVLLCRGRLILDHVMFRQVMHVETLISTFTSFLHNMWKVPSYFCGTLPHFCPMSIDIAVICHPKMSQFWTAHIPHYPTVPMFLYLCAYTTIKSGFSGAFQPHPTRESRSIPAVQPDKCSQNCKLCLLVVDSRKCWLIERGMIFFFICKEKTVRAYAVWKCNYFNCDRRFAVVYSFKLQL